METSITSSNTSVTAAPIGGGDMPLSFQNPKLEPFPLHALPDMLRQYVEALAENTQTPTDMAGTLVLTIIAAIMQGHYRVLVKNGWKEPVNLYSLIILPPSERKSAILNVLLEPISRHEEEVNDSLQEEIERSESDKRILEGRRTALEKQAAKGYDVDDALQDISREIVEFEEVKPYRIFYDNITPEKLTSALAENKGRAAIFSSEGGIFDILKGAYSSSVNIDVLLKAYSGDTIRCDRITRASESIRRPALSLALMGQPGILEGVMKNEVFRGRGLTARFLYSVPQSKIGSRRFFTAPIPPETIEAYEQMIEDLFRDEEIDDERIITLSEEALDMLSGYAEHVEKRLTEDLSEIQDWAGKLVGNTVRIAAVLARASAALANPGSGSPETLEIDVNTMTNAEVLGVYYLSHAGAAYNLMGSDLIHQHCRQVLKVIRREKLVLFTRRDMMRLCRQFRTADEMQAVLNMLEEAGYISAEGDAPLPGRGRKPNVSYRVNLAAMKESELEMIKSESES